MFHRHKQKNQEILRPALICWIVWSLVLFACAPAHRVNIDDSLSGKIIWPGPPEQPRIRYLWSLYSFAPEGKDFIDYIAGSVAEGTDLAAIPYILRPYGLYLDENNKLCIVDQGIPRITLADLKSGEVVHFGYERGEGQLSMPIDCAFSSDGQIYVTDSEAGAVNVYNARGKFIRVLSGKDVFMRPTGITIEKMTGRIYVLDTAEHRCVVFDAAGQRLFQFGKRGNGDGEFNYPTHVASGGDGRIYITDALNFRIQVFNADGGFLKKFGSYGDSYADLDKPKGVAVDTFGNVYVVDAGREMVKIFDNDGRLLLFFGEGGQKAGQFSLPSDIFIDSQNRIYVADTYNMRIQVFELIGGQR